MQFAHVNGVTLHYQVIAAPEDKPTIVFSNSLATDFRIWRDCIVRLVGECSILMYDKRGHGLSDLGETPYIIDDHVNDLAALMDHLGLSNAVICGLSVGGLIAQGLLYTRPDLVRAMILCDTAAKIGSDEMWDTRIAAVEEGGLASICDGNMERWFTENFHQNNPVELQGYKNMFNRMPVEGYLATAKAIRNADLRAAAIEVKVPSICIVGEEDGSTPPDLVLATAKLIPDCRYEVIKGAAHIPCVEQPEMLVEIIKAFLKDADIT
ncbi:MAG: 3-oxoadipate enol-lactonase [Pseudomonadota bacterium]